MPKLFAATFTVYFEAFDQATAERFAPLYTNRITQALRAKGWITDKVTMATFLAESVREVTPAEHRQALRWEPPKACYEGMSQQLMNHLAGA